jgi:hypothetical protein
MKIEIPSNLDEDDFSDSSRNTIAAYTTAEPLEMPPFSDDMSKDEMIAHIMDVHQHYGYINGKSFSRYGTKVTKAEMIDWHDHVHEILDSGVLVAREGWARGQVAVMVTSGREGLHGTVALPTMPHSHMAVALSQTQEAAAENIRQGKKVEGVLSVTERKVLTQVVDNDFGSLKQEMRAFAADTLASVKDEINEEWDKKERSIPDFASRATARARKFHDKKAAITAKFQAEIKALAESYQDDLQAIQKSAKEQGVLLSDRNEATYDENTGERINRTVYVASVEGREQALTAAEAENTTMLNRALMDLERQRLTAQRQVLLSGVPEGAMPILESIPDAKTLMVQSAKESAQNQIEARQTS